MAHVDLDSHICPKCGGDEYVYTYDDYRSDCGYALMHCDNTYGSDGCGTFYEVYYDLQVTKIKVRL